MLKNEEEKFLKSCDAGAKSDARADQKRIIVLSRLSVNIISSDTTVMTIVKDEKYLTGELYRFWFFDTVAIKETEDNVLEYFMENIQFENGRYYQIITN